MKLKTLLLTLFLSISVSASAGIEEGDKAWYAKDYQTAYNEWKPLADNGNMEAIGNMALLYEGGYFVEKNEELALKMHLIAANAGIQDAQMNLAYFYYYRGSYKGANKWTLAALQQDYKDSELRNNDFKFLKNQLILNKLDSVDSKKTLDYITNIANSGDIDVQYQLGDYYYSKSNYKESFKWIHKAALQGHLIAQNNVGTAYGYGEGVEKDLDKLLHWKTLAAKGGQEIAQRDLVEMHTIGYGVDKNLELAKYWAEIVRENKEHTYLDKVNELWEEYELWKY